MFRVSHDDSLKLYVNGSLQYCNNGAQTRTFIVPFARLMSFELLSFNDTGGQNCQVYAFPINTA